MDSPPLRRLARGGFEPASHAASNVIALGRTQLPNIDFNQALADTARQLRRPTRRAFLTGN